MIENLKKELEDIAEMRFTLDMKDVWTNEDYDKDDRMYKRIKEIIKELDNNGIIAYYQHGYEITYEEKKGE